jgi:hypothetical protein
MAKIIERGGFVILMYLVLCVTFSSAEAGATVQPGISITDYHVVIALTQATQTDSLGPVTVAATYVGEEQGKTGLELTFKIIIETRSVDLGQYDLAALSILRNDVGDFVKPLRWIPTTKKEHHISGTLFFPEQLLSGNSIIGRGASYIELMIENIGGIKEKVFHWNLPQ